MTINQSRPFERMAVASSALLILFSGIAAAYPFWATFIAAVAAMCWGFAILDVQDRLEREDGEEID